MTPEEVWRGKSDEQLLVASTRLGEYNEVGQRVILAELQRRRQSGSLSDTLTAEVVTQAVEDTGTLESGTGAQPGLLRRLWRGDVPLGRTYWAHGVLTNFMWLFVMTIAMNLRLTALALPLVILYPAYVLFIVVAIWRSSARYTGNRIWGDLARVSLALGFIRMFANMFVRT